MHLIAPSLAVFFDSKRNIKLSGVFFFSCQILTTLFPQGRLNGTNPYDAPLGIKSVQALSNLKKRINVPGGYWESL